MYRSKPLVTLAAKDTPDIYAVADAGSPTAACRSVAFVQRLGPRPGVLDSAKSFKELYDETRHI